MGFRLKHTDYRVSRSDYIKSIIIQSVSVTVRDTAGNIAAVILNKIEHREGTGGNGKLSIVHVQEEADELPHNHLNTIK